MAGCGATSEGGPSADVGSLGVLSSGWSVRFTSADGATAFYNSSLTTAGRQLTFTMRRPREGMALDPGSACIVTTDRVTFTITVADDGSALSGSFVAARRYDGGNCPDWVTVGVEDRETHLFSGRRRSTATSIFGNAGGEWDILDNRGAVSFSLTLRGSSFNGMINQRTSFQGVFSGSTLVGNGGNALFNGMRP